MKPLRIFISSVQKELAEDRMALRNWLNSDPLMRRFFESFLFEELPAIDRSSSEIYLSEVAKSDLYIGLFGNDYGYEDHNGISPTEYEFNEATTRQKNRLIFIKGSNDQKRHPKMQVLVNKVGNELVRRR